MSDLVDSVRSALARDALVPPGGRVLVALSGGPDSAALLVALAALRRTAGLTLFAATVDHGLRPEARAEAEAAGRFAAVHDVPHAILPVTVSPPTMEAARTARYRALVAEARRVGASAIAVAHTASDQAETLLDRLLRGAGARGLAGMAPRRDEGGVWLVRPLLDVSRDEVERFVVARGLAVARDPTNADARFRRTRLRERVVPALRAERPDLDHHLAALARRLREDDAALEGVAAAALAGARLPGPALVLDRRALAPLPAAVLARVLRQAVPDATLSARHLAALARLIETGEGTRRLDLPGLRAERRYDRLHLTAPAREPDEPGDVAALVEAPGTYTLLGAAVHVSAPVFAAAGAPGATLLLRNLRPGDRAPGRTRTLADVLVDRKVPRPLRRRLPLFVRRWLDGARPDEVLWVAPATSATPLSDGATPAPRHPEQPLEVALTGRGRVQ